MGSPLRSLAGLVVTVGLAVGIVLLLEAFVVKPYRIPSRSMEPTLTVGSRVLANRMAGDPGLGDIVVFHPPTGANPADLVCGNPRQGPGYLEPCGRAVPHESNMTYIKRVVGLPGDRIAVVNGYVIRNGVRVKAPYVRSCPGVPECELPKAIVVPRGEYFLMGDNRDDSEDSRFWGPVPASWIIGVAFFTYWPPSRIGFT